MADTTPTLRMSYREACRQALRDALMADPRAFVMGEDVGKYGGCYAVTKGLLEEFGPQRILDTPLAENGFTGIGIGAAVAGLRPIVEIMTCNFSLLALDQIMNNAATLAHMSGGQFAVPLVIRMATGGGRQLAAQHSHSLEGWYAHIPGLKVLAPATVEDARHMLAAALADPNPVLIFEHVVLYNTEGELDPAVQAVDLRSIAATISATPWRSRWKKPPWARKRRSAFPGGTPAIPAMAMVPSPAPASRPAPPATAWVRCRCARAFSAFSKPARIAAARARSSLNPARPVAARARSNAKRPWKCRFPPVSMMA